MRGSWHADAWRCEHWSLVKKKSTAAAAACVVCLQVPAQVPVRTFVESYFGFKHSFFVSGNDT